MAMQPTRVPLQILVAIGLAVLPACDRTTSNPDPTTNLTAQGQILGQVYEDANGNGRLDPSDPPIPLVEVRASYRGTQVPVAVDTSGTGAMGSYQMQVPVGSYWVTVDSMILGDSFQVIEKDTTIYRVLPGLNTTANLGLTFRRFSVEDLRQLPPGQAVSVLAFALNDRSAFGDSTIHISDGTWAIRAINTARATVRQGDSIRIAGTTGTDLGQPVLDFARATVLQATGTPPAPLLTSAQAGTADNGRHDANHVRIQGATVIDTVSVGLDFQATVDDGSGPLTVFLDRDAFSNTNAFRPGNMFSELRGLLKPNGTGGWILLPRNNNDVIF